MEKATLQEILGARPAKFITSKLSVKDSYEDFWNNVKYNKGWMQPAFPKEDVSEYLDEASEIVALVRTALDKTNPNVLTLRQVEGSSREYLWTLQMGFLHPKDFPADFVRNLVHSTFQDANGYVEDLSEQVVDDVITAYYAWKEEQAELKKKQDADLATRLTTHWKDVALKVDGFLGCDMCHDTKHMNAILRHIQSIENHIKIMQEEAEQRKKQEAIVDEHRKELALLRKNKERLEVEKKLEETLKRKEAEMKKREIEEKERKEKEEKMRTQLTESMDKQAWQAEKQDEQEKVLKITRVQEDVSNIQAKIEHLTQNLNEERIEDLWKKPKEGKKIVDGLQKKCLAYSEFLMRDLLQLDEVVGSSNLRPLRKKQVNNIQQLLKDVDSLTKRLNDLGAQLEESDSSPSEGSDTAEPEEANKDVEMHESLEEPEDTPMEDAEAEKTADKPDTDEVEPEKAKPDKVPTEDVWRKLKLDPQLSVREQTGAYVITGYVPGVSDEDMSITLTEKGDTLVIKGFRGPTPRDIALMKQKIRQVREGSMYDIDNIEDDELMLRLGSGRFGSFTKSYYVPDDCNASEITATYKGGNIRVTIPKVRRTPQFRQQDMYPFGRRRDNFFNDSNFWW